VIKFHLKSLQLIVDVDQDRVYRGRGLRLLTVGSYLLGIHLATE